MRQPVNLAVRPLNNERSVNAVLRHPAIIDKLRHDGREPGYIDNSLVRYAGAWVNGRLQGVFAAVDFTPWEVEAHVAILPTAIRHTRTLCLLFLAQEFEATDLLRVTAYTTRAAPANLCRRLGFVDEGVRRQAYRRNGETGDVTVLGITRTDWLRSCLRASLE